MKPEVFVVQTEPRYSEALGDAFSSLFRMWGKDPANPFKEYVGPGGSVVLKPNWVRHYNPNGHNLDSLITHASVLAHLIECAAVALQGRGTVVIGDAPLQSCRFDQLLERSGIGAVVSAARQRHPGIQWQIEDWRLTLMDQFDGFSEWDKPGAQIQRADYAAEVAQKYRLTDLGRGSFLEDLADYADRFRVTCYKPSLMRAHHAAGKHEYLVTRRIFGADLLINVPKMKTHIKAGLTGALKNLVGINGHKEYLAHHIKGSYFQGGDDYCVTSRLRTLHDDLYDRVWEDYMTLPDWKRRFWMRTLRLLWRASHVASGDNIDAGSWSGNETVWRTTLDLNHILYFDPHAPKHVLTVVDGVVAGEGNGPLSPTPKPMGLLVAGENPAYVDAVLGKLMGYNISRVPTVYHAIYHRKSRFAGPFLEDSRVACLLKSSHGESVPFVDLPNLHFVKPDYWKRAESSCPKGQ